MFEEETKELIEIILRRVAEGRSKVAVKDILAAGIPSPLKTFFHADAEALLEKEQRTYLGSSRFNHSLTEVQNHQRQINSILIMEFVYTDTEFYDRLNDALRLLTAYLGQPQRTIVESVFDTPDPISIEAVKNFLRFYEPYDYLKKLVLHYFYLKKIRMIDRTSFSSVLQKLDGAYIQRKNGNEVAKTLLPFFDLINYLRIGEERRLPVRALESYFADKGLSSAVSLLMSTRAQGKVSMTDRELAGLLDGIRQTCGALIVERDNAEPVHAPTPVPPSPQPAEAVKPPSPEPPPRAADQNILLNEADRRRFIKKIFRQDADAFTYAIEKLQQLPRWREASKAIDEIFISQEIDPYSSDAVRFLEVLFKHYYPS